MSPIFWFIIAGIIVGGIAILVAIAAVNGVRLSAGFALPTWLNVGTIVLVIAGVVVFFVGIYKPTLSNPHPATMGSWGQGHWLMLLMLWGIGAALVALNACGAVAKTLQWVLAGVVLVLLVGFPTIGWLGEVGSSRPTQTRARVEQTQRRKVSFPAYGETPHISVRYGYAPVFTGSGFELHCVYESGSEDVGSPTHPCRDGSVRYVFARDISGRPNSVVYEFIPADIAK